VSEDLPVQDDSWWNALVAHSEWVWFMILAVIVDFVANILYKCAILALSVRRVTLLALLTLLDNPIVKALVLKHSLISIEAVRAFSTGWMLAEVLECRCLGIFLSDAKTVHAFLVGAVPAL
jgi:hypothetical protein